MNKTQMFSFMCFVSEMFLAKVYTLNICDLTLYLKDKKLKSLNMQIYTIKK